MLHLSVLVDDTVAYLEAGHAYAYSTTRNCALGVNRLRKFAELFSTREHFIRLWEPTAQMLELFITCVIRIAQVAVGTLKVYLYEAEARHCGQRVEAMCACGVDHEEFSRH
eukprot:g13127.t1